MTGSSQAAFQYAFGARSRLFRTTSEISESGGAHAVREHEHTPPGHRPYAHPPERGQPVADFIAGLTDVDAAAVIAAMKEVALEGLRASRHLRGDLYEIRAEGDRVTYRILFAPEGAHGQVLLALEAFGKKTPKTPPQAIALAERRLKDWRARGAGLSRS
jgi:phage-related protein